MKKKTMAILALLLVLSLALAACAPAAQETQVDPVAPAAPAEPGTPAEPDEPSEPAAEVGEVTTIELWVGDWWANEVEWIETQFAADNPGWAVNVVLQPVAGYLDSAIAAVAGGAGPDVLDLDTLMVPGAINAGIIRPLDDFMARYGITPDMFVEANYVAGVQEGLNYSIPNRNAPMAMIYNIDMFNAAGVDFPTDRMSIADFRALANDLTRGLDANQFGFGIAATRADLANVMTSFLPFLWGTGGDILTPDMSDVLINSPQSVEGITHWIEMYTVDNSVPPGSIDYAITRDLFPLFQIQQLAMMPMNDNNMAVLMAGQEDGSVESFEWGMVLVPGYGRSAGWSFTIPEGANVNVEGAEIFINWYIQPHIASQNNTVMPAIIAAQTEGRWGDPDLDIFYQQMPFTKNVPPHARWVEIQEVLVEELQNGLMGNAPPAEIAESMAERIRVIIS